MKLSVILSFKNEEEVLPGLFPRLDKVMSGLGEDYEYIFVNDASTDRSLEMIMERAKSDRHVKILNTSRSFGHDECLFAGLRYSTGDAIVIVAADCEDPPELIPQLWNEFKNGIDVVYTTRLSRPGDSAFKKFVTKIAYRALYRMTKVVVPDSGDFRLISRKVLTHILKLEERNPFFRGLTFWAGFKHKQVFYHREKRSGGVCHFPLWSDAPARFFLNAVTSYSRWPIYTMLKVALAFICGSLLFGAALLVAATLGRTITGWTIVCTVLFFLSGTHLLFLGFVGLYACSAYDESRKRPNYIIKDTYGFETEEVK
jgi:polyisoprenyl-phosphate glycosyltransferase